MRHDKQAFAKYDLRRHWLRIQQHGYDEPSMCLSIAHPKVKQSITLAIPVSAMGQHKGFDGNKKTGGHHANHILEPETKHDIPCLHPSGGKLAGSMEIVIGHGHAHLVSPVYLINGTDPLTRLWMPLTDRLDVDGRLRNLKCRGDCVHYMSRSNALKAVEIIYLSLSSFIFTASVNFIAQGYAFAAESLLSLSLRRVMLYQLTVTHVCFGSTHLLYLLWAK